MPQPDTYDKEIIIVTGSSGLIGRGVIDHLRRQYQIVGFDRDGNPQPPPEVECVCVDLTDESSVDLGLQRMRYAYGERIASVVHLAAYYDFAGEPSPLYDAVTVQGTRRLIDGLQRFHVEQFIFSSTMLVHAPTQPARPITEASPIEGKWDYPQSKIDTEDVLYAHHGDIPCISLRIAGVYTDHCDSIPLAQQIARIHEKQLTARVFPGDVSHGQSFVHLHDVVDAITKCIERRHALPRGVTPVLIGESETLSYAELQRSFARLLHGEDDWETREIPKAIAKTGAWVQDRMDVLPGVDQPFIKPWMIDLAGDHYELDISRARELLGWTPKRSLRATLPRMAQALCENPEGWYKRHRLEPPHRERECASNDRNP